MSPPQQIDRYLVEHELGRGAFGVVFRARHAVTGRAVALKVLHSRHVGDTELVERFFREARAAASTRSPHIVDVLDASVAADGAPFLALELLEGSDLEGRLTREGRLPLAEALRLAREIATGLEAAHRSGVIHRDLKPANVFLARQGDGSTRVKILDFGMSKLAEPSAVRTGTGAVMGTPLYMAPEQLAGGAREADARADLYALGAILFEMLAGTAPHDAPSLDALVTLKLTQPARDLATLAPGVPGPVVALVHRCLSLRPDARPASATEVQEALATLDRSSAPTPSTATPSSATPSAPTLVAPPPPVQPLMPPVTARVDLLPRIPVTLIGPGMQPGTVAVWSPRGGPSIELGIMPIPGGGYRVYANTGGAQSTVVDVPAQVAQDAVVTITQRPDQRLLVRAERAPGARDAGQQMLMLLQMLNGAPTLAEQWAGTFSDRVPRWAR